MTKVTIIGAGGHARSSINLLKHCLPDAACEILDESFTKDANEYIADIKVTGKIKEVRSDSSVFLSVGDNRKRKILFEQFAKQVIKQNLFHKTTTIEEHVEIGDSNQFFAHSYINSYTIIGDNNIINTSSIIEHEVNIGSHNHISIGAKVCGRVTIGNGCMVGAGAIIVDKVSICDNVIVGAGAVVIKDITENGTYVGIPARKIK